MTIWPRSSARSLAFLWALLSLITMLAIGCNGPEHANGDTQQPVTTFPRLVADGRRPTLMDETC
jgi:hypothetical protein